MKDIEQRKAELREIANREHSFGDNSVPEAEKRVAKEALEIIDQQAEKEAQLIHQNYAVEEGNGLFQKENQSLKEEVEKLKEELEERKAYIVANPCAHCGGRINAGKAEALAVKNKKLEEKLEIATRVLTNVAEEVYADPETIAKEALKQLKETNDK